MFSFLKKLFHRPASKDIAKERLQLILARERVSPSPSFLERVKDDIIQVVNHYLEIDAAAAQVRFVHQESMVALMARIPVLSVKPAALGKKEESGHGEESQLDC